MYRKFRLTDREEFQRVRRDGKSWAHPLVVLIARPNEVSHLRTGFAAGKNVGGATARNRAKRLLREAVRLNLMRIRSGWDMIWLARAPLAKATYAEAEAAVLALLRRARLMQADTSSEPT